MSVKAGKAILKYIYAEVSKNSKVKIITPLHMQAANHPRRRWWSHPPHLQVAYWLEYGQAEDREIYPGVPNS